ncbi:hypothetical protein JCM16408A_13320 [Methylobacterium phyllosphaerae]|nr:hypothetical protein [Methylobacterium phyllosphaerae]
MRGCLPRTVQGRAIIAMIALYALVLQAFLGGLVALPAAPLGSVICAEHDGSSSSGDQGPACHQHACCTAVQAVQLIHPMLTVFATVAWAPPQVAPVAWRDAGMVQARAPPQQSVSPRGPPAV